MYPYDRLTGSDADRSTQVLRELSDLDVLPIHSEPLPVGQMDFYDGQLLTLFRQPSHWELRCWMSLNDQDLIALMKNHRNSLKLNGEDRFWTDTQIKRGVLLHLHGELEGIRLIHVSETMAMKALLVAIKTRHRCPKPDHYYSVEDLIRLRMLPNVCRDVRNIGSEMH